jgi:predicted DNA-binding helix-hairpin-helix protein
MFYNVAMDVWERVRILAKGAVWDRDEEPRESAEPQRGTCPRVQGSGDLPISWVSMGGKKVPILKTLLTSACERDCAYCPFRAGRNTQRTTLRPEQMASVVDEMHHRGAIRGALVSSGLAGGSIATQDRILTTAHILRRRGFRGYLHIKLMPGAEKDQVLEAMRLADRVSVNLEAPGEPYLRKIAPHKQFWDELLLTLQRAEEIRTSLDPRDFGRDRWPSLVTQFVVGAAGERDRDLLSWTKRLLRDLHVARVYFSPFRPIEGTPLADHPPEDHERTRRLYQAFFLLRDYGFDADELPWTSEGALRPGDPKVLWARSHLADDPVEVNTAPWEMLLRIPGIGPKRAKALLQARRQGTLRTLRDLQALSIPAAKVAPYILLDGKRPEFQLPLFSTDAQDADNR